MEEIMRLKYIKKMNDNDKKVLIAMAKCGYVAQEELLKIITSNRIYSFKKEGIIIKDAYYHEKNKIVGYRLSEKGKKMVKEVLGINYIKHAQTVLHDSITLRFYLHLIDDFISKVQSEKNLNINKEKGILKDTKNNVDLRQKKIKVLELEENDMRRIVIEGKRKGKSEYETLKEKGMIISIEEIFGDVI